PPPASARYAAYSPTRVLPDPVGAETSRFRPASSAANDSSWNGSGVKPSPDRKDSRSPAASGDVVIQGATGGRGLRWSGVGGRAGDGGGGGDRGRTARARGPVEAPGGVETAGGL